MEKAVFNVFTAHGNLLITANRTFAMELAQILAAAGDIVKESEHNTAFDAFMRKLASNCGRLGCIIPPELQMGNRPYFQREEKQTMVAEEEAIPSV